MRRRQAFDLTSHPDRPPSHLPGGEPLDPLTEEALAWLVRLHSGAETAQDWADYEAWQAAAPGRREAADRAARLWAMLGPALAEGGVKAKGPPGIPVVLAAALGLGLLAFGSGLLGPPAALLADERTGVGERRSVTMPDGSRIDIDTSTSLDIAEGGRRITLHAGQVYVTVAADPRRPFVLRSGDGDIRAVGTAFDVRRDAGATRVVVTENAVEVSHPDAAGGVGSVTVRAGQEVAYTSGAGLGSVAPADLPTRTAWRRGQMRFDSRPLGEVFDEMARYRRGAVVFLERDLRELPVTGIFATGDIDAMLDALATLMPLQLTRLPFLTIVRRDAARMPAR